MSGIARRAALNAIHRPIFRPTPIRYFPAAATQTQDAGDREAGKSALTKGEIDNCLARRSALSGRSP